MNVTGVLFEVPNKNFVDFGQRLKKKKMFFKRHYQYYV